VVGVGLSSEGVSPSTGLPAPAGMGLLAPDPIFPQRDALLDEKIIGARIAAFLATAAAAPCERKQVRYRPRRDLQVLYRVGADSDASLVSVHAFASGESAAVYAQALAGAGDEGPRPWVTHVPDLDAVFWAFPHDRAIVGLPVLADPPPDLRSMVPGWSGSEFLTYLPARSAVVRCLDGEGRPLAYVKAYADDRGARTRRAMDAFRASRRSDAEPLRTPAALGYSFDWRVLATEPMAGHPMTELEGAALELECRRLGEALAAMHAAPVSDLPAFERHGSRRLATATQTIALAVPDAEVSVGRLVARLEATRAGGKTASVCLHGDVKMPNVIVGQHDLAIIDFDTACFGPPEADLGHFLGVLRAERCLGRRSAPETGRLEASFLDGYLRGGRRFEAAALAWHTAASMLIKRAARLVTTARSHTLRHLPTILAEASQALEGVAKI